MVSNRIDRRKRKRKRRRKTIFSVIMITFLSLVIFSIYQYWAGINEAEERIDLSEEEKDKKSKYEEDFNPEEPVNDKINVLILGEDKDAQGVSRTDTIMLGQYDAENDRAKLVSLMRDTYVKIPGHGHNKLNAAYAFGGPELLRKTIKENFGIDIHYYAIVNYEGFEHIVDTIAPNGVEINVEKRMYYHDNAGNLHIDLQPGMQRLNGEELLEYARFRHDAESDFGRVRRQQQVMSVLKEEMLSFTNLLKIPKAVGTLVPYIYTNMDTSTIIKYAMSFFSNTPDEIETMRIPMEGTYRNAHSDHAGSILDVDIQENAEALQDFFIEGIKPVDEDELNNSNSGSDSANTNG